MQTDMTRFPNCPPRLWVKHIEIEYKKSASAPLSSSPVREVRSLPINEFYRLATSFAIRFKSNKTFYMNVNAFIEVATLPSLTTNSEKHLTDDITKYLALPNPSLKYSDETEIANWWLKNKTVYPVLAKVANRIISKVATSALPKKEVSKIEKQLKYTVKFEDSKTITSSFKNSPFDDEIL
ncbi:hypothetical protein OUZ56_010086 [Daphnia magna]|uniref:HAT C-terminal dimerisation domain-containing protein n=1 Tax=Daphnia magna TaxID=35525 RepID=A0ABR0AHR1_9CRUS|nr:hypothetical protein OUZ56_010086 [Daphnia magna]